ncbi:vesicle-associated membrane protein 7 [Caerostris darwini]|uniref:AP-3 complex subunit delta-1 n=1 Tax=Caerostris darwini TaxID=1538125 RepID=A0AAV4UM64_9ARAC|nr:vesicle-associated membrane protein 7 [Caerostris darwini]
MQQMANEKATAEKALSLHLTYLNDPDIQADPVILQSMENIVRRTSSKVDYLTSKHLMHVFKWLKLAYIMISIKTEDTINTINLGDFAIIPQGLKRFWQLIPIYLAVIQIYCERKCLFSKISPDQPKLTYSHGSYLFHYIYEDDIIYLCITDDDFDRSHAFGFLNETKRRFKSAYGARALTALPYAMNSEFSRILASQMKHFSESKDVDKLAKVQGEIDELTEIMVQNIDTVANRGEKLELLVDKTENLTSASVTFRKTSRGLARSMCIKNVKITVIIIIVMLVILYIIVSASCGGLSWPTCV